MRISLALMILFASTLVAAQSATETATLGDMLFAAVEREQVNAKRDYEEYQAQKQGIRHDQWTDCVINGARNHCSFGSPVVLEKPLPPLPARSPRVAAQLDTSRAVGGTWPEHPTFEPLRSWLLVRNPKDVEDSANTLERMSKSGALYDCLSASPPVGKHETLYPGRCVIVKAVQAKPARTVFAECRAEQTGTRASFPMHCLPLQFSNDRNMWTWAVTKLSVNGSGPALRTERLQVIEPNGSRTTSDAALLRAVDAVLATEPFRIRDRELRGTLLVGNGAQQFSHVVPGGWFEQALIYVSVQAAELTIDCNLAVNKTNTARNIDWHPATEPQEALYCTTLRERLTAALEPLCGGGAERNGTNVLRCR